MKTLAKLISQAYAQGYLVEWCDNDIKSWLVGPVGRSRDSEIRETSNWEVVIARLAEIDPDEKDHRVIRFGHCMVGWGWIEELITRPGTACAAYATECKARLADYPILDEHHKSMLEFEAEGHAWNQWGAREFVTEMVNEFGLGAAAHTFLSNVSKCDLWELYTDGLSSGEYSEIAYGGGFFYTESLEDLSREDLARFIKRMRNVSKVVQS